MAPLTPNEQGLAGGFKYWNTPDKSGVTRRQRKYAEEVGVDATLDVLGALPCLGGSPMDGPCCSGGSCVTCEARRRTRGRTGGER